MRYLAFVLFFCAFTLQASLVSINQQDSAEKLEMSLAVTAAELASAIVAIDKVAVKVETQSNRSRLQLSIYLPESSLGSLKAFSGIKIRNLKMVLNEIYLAQQKRIDSKVELKALMVDFYSY